MQFDLMRYSTQQRVDAFGGNRNGGDRKTGNGKNHALEKTGKMSSPVGARRCDKAGYAAADEEAPRHAGLTDEMLLCRPVLANPLNLQGSNRGKVYGLAAKCQEITARSARGGGRAIHAAGLRQHFIRRDADFPPARHACRQAGARFEQARTYGFGT